VTSVDRLLQLLVPVATLLAAVGGLSALLLGLYSRRETRQNLAALGEKAKAEGAQVVVSSAITLLQPLRGEVDALQKRVNELTAQLDAALERARNAEAEADALRRGDNTVADELAARRRREHRG
jgi:outer membrane murein-binding lipoprotein Lpp